ncbi:fatty acid--CoA ligase family protein [Micrococcus sp.]|uniref:class I adenylate-forming enzyme family protein n=1 Tax=Micrococcus sp. TaxID=1271 RepID=UPI002A90BAE2|nr:fatty acid--CoA ligase family protein [Micrococcus sp.]MDY6054975.1 fatty acid--CoA ligase family protein [Micrococcus sp.]
MPGPTRHDDGAPASAPRPTSQLASRLAPLRGGDHAAVLHRALEARASGRVPLVGDERWSEEHWQASVAHAEQLLADLTADHPGRAAQVAWAAFTSGSTGRPRVVLRTASSWEVGHRHAARWLGLRPGDRLLVPVHPVSSMAVNAADLCARTGAELRVPGRARLRAEDLEAVTAVHCTPSQLEDLCDLIEARAETGPDPVAPATSTAPALRAALVGGDRLPAGLRERAAGLGVRVVHYYGSAEASFVAVDPDGTGLRPLPDVRLEVRAGVLHVRSEQTAEPDATVLASGTPRWSPDGWLCTGDRAEIDDGGVLHLRGRADDAILTGGATVIPAEVEAELLRAGACSAVLVLGRPAPRLGSLVVAYVEPFPGRQGPSGEEVLAVLQEHARRHLPPAARPRRWHLVDRLERTGSGKVRRLAPDAGVASAPGIAPDSGTGPSTESAR